MKENVTFNFLVFLIPENTYFFYFNFIYWFLFIYSFFIFIILKWICMFYCQKQKNNIFWITFNRKI